MEQAAGLHGSRGDPARFVQGLPGVALAEHGLFQAGLDGLALDAKEVPGPGPGGGECQLIDGHPVVGVLLVIATLFEELDSTLRDGDVAGAGGPGVGLGGGHHPAEEGKGRLLGGAGSTFWHDEHRASGGDRGADIAGQGGTAHLEAGVALQVAEEGGGGPDHRRAAGEEVVVGGLPGVVVAARRGLHQALADHALPEGEGPHPWPLRRGRVCRRVDHRTSGPPDERGPEPPVHRAPKPQRVIPPSGAAPLVVRATARSSSRGGRRGEAELCEEGFA